MIGMAFISLKCVSRSSALRSSCKTLQSLWRSMSAATTSSSDSRLKVVGPVIPTKLIINAMDPSFEDYLREVYLSLEEFNSLPEAVKNQFRLEGSRWLTAKARLQPIPAPAPPPGFIDVVTASTSEATHPFLQRWKDLNVIFDEIIRTKSKKPNVDVESSSRSVAYSSVKWRELGKVYSPLLNNFVIESKAIPVETFDVLYSYISMVVRSNDGINFGKEALRMQFIAPIIVSVCSVHKGVTILFESDLNGKRLQVSGHFEMMIQKGNKRICIVVAKKEDMDQGLCQVLLGCEAAVDVDGLDIAYGISTTYESWAFVKLDVNSDKVLKSNWSMRVGNNGMPEKEDLAKLCGIINTILS